MSKKQQTTPNQTYICNGCQNHCRFGIHKDKGIFYRPTLDDKIIYDYKTSDDFYGHHNSLCFTEQNARKLIRSLMQLCIDNTAAKKTKKQCISEKPNLLYGYTSKCYGCINHCETGITMQNRTIYRPVINGRIIYDYTIHKRDISEYHDTISFSAANAQIELYFLTRYCAFKCPNKPLGKTR